MKPKLLGLLAVLALFAAAPLRAQQISVQNGLIYASPKNPTQPMMIFHPGAKLTTNQLEFHDLTGATIFKVDPNGLPGIGTSGTYQSVDSETTVDGSSAFITSPMATATTLRGAEFRVKTTGGNHATTGFLQALRADAVMDTGTAALEEVWGTNSTAELNAGATNAAYGTVGDLQINTGVTINGAINSGTFGVFGQSYVNTGVTYTNGAQDIALGGIVLESNGRRKADAAVAAILQGAQNQSTAGAGAAFKVYDSNTQANFDYGLDLEGYSSTYSNTFNSADIRLSSGVEILTGTGVPAGGLCTATNLGAMYLNHGGGAGTTLYVCEVAGAWAAK
jgi:hypothetical protein